MRAFIRTIMCVYIQAGRQTDRQIACMHRKKERKKNNCNFLTLTSHCCTIDFSRCLCSCLSFCLPNCGCACRQTDGQTNGQTDRRTDRPKPLCIKQSTKKEPKKQKYLKTKQTARTHLHTHIHTYIHTFTKSRGYLDIKNCSTHKNNDTHLKEPVLIRQIYLKTICVKGWKFHPGT